jgi:hypothetical protein
MTPLQLGAMVLPSPMGNALLSATPGLSDEVITFNPREATSRY